MKKEEMEDSTLMKTGGSDEPLLAMKDEAEATKKTSYKANMGETYNSSHQWRRVRGTEEQL